MLTEERLNALSAVSNGEVRYKLGRTRSEAGKPQLWVEPREYTVALRFCAKAGLVTPELEDGFVKLTEAGKRALSQTAR